MSWNNQVILVGSLGADPEMRFTQGGQAVMNFRMATTERFTDRNNAQREETEWHSCVWFGDKASDAAAHMHKGSYVRVEGKLKTESYEKDGQKRYTTKIYVSHVAPAAFPKSHDTSPAPAPAYAPGNPIPFGALAGQQTIDSYGDFNY